MFSLKISFLLLAICIAYTTADIVDFHPCDGIENSCTVKEVRIDSCQNYEAHTACRIRRRKPATMSFDFVPDFDADQLDIKLTWVKNEGEELPLLTLDKDACKHMSCPIKTGEQQTYSVDVPIENRFPLNAYTIKWALETPSQDKKCCFTTDIKVVR